MTSRPRLCRLLSGLLAAGLASTAPAADPTLPREHIADRLSRQLLELEGKQPPVLQAERADAGATPAVHTSAPSERHVAAAVERVPVPEVAAQPRTRLFPQLTGHQKLIGVIEGIPRHQVVVASLPQSEVDIVIDGRVDEPVWMGVPAYDNMLSYVPATAEPSNYPTEMRILATDHGLYVSAVMYQPPDTLVARRSNRDQFIDRDSFGITLDTSGKGLYAYWFMIGLGDTMSDGKVLPERKYQRDWDGPWIGKTARFDEGWSAEMFLPWSMMNLRETDGPRQLGFVVNRPGLAHQQAVPVAGIRARVAEIRHGHEHDGGDRCPAQAGASRHSIQLDHLRPGEGRR